MLVYSLFFHSSRRFLFVEQELASARRGFSSTDTSNGTDQLFTLRSLSLVKLVRKNPDKLRTCSGPRWGKLLIRGCTGPSVMPPQRQLNVSEKTCQFFAEDPSHPFKTKPEDLISWLCNQEHLRFSQTCPEINRTGLGPGAAQEVIPSVGMEGKEGLPAPAWLQMWSLTACKRSNGPV